MRQPRTGRSAWMLFVKQAKEHDIALHRLGLRPSKYNAADYIGFYANNAKPIMLQHIEEVKRLGLHGLAKILNPKIKQTQPTKYKSTPVSTTFDATITQFQVAKELRLTRDALKRAQDERRQAEKRANAEVNRRAKEAILRAKGEM